MKKLYIIDYENAHFCGGQLNVLVWAETEDEAQEIAADHMAEAQYELYWVEYNDPDEDYDGEHFYAVNSVEEFNESHDQWKFFLDPSQESFYPICNSPN